jgi:outer membrane protein, heavy metal efflux system
MRKRFLCLGGLLFGLSACQTSAPRGNSSQVRDAIANAIAGRPQLPDIHSEFLSPQWFAAPLSLERAVQTALLNNPNVRIQLARLDAAQLEQIQAGLLRNPMASVMALRPNGGGRFELDYGVTQSILDVLYRSRRINAASAAQKMTEAEVIAALIDLCGQTSRAYFAAVKAKATWVLREKQLALEQRGAKLAKRQAENGAAAAGPALEQQAMVAKLAHAAKVAQSELISARANLAALLGLSSAADLQLPEALPKFLMPGLAQFVLQANSTSSSADLNVAKAQLEQKKIEQELVTANAALWDPHAGIAGTRESGGNRLNGAAIQLTVPLFDNGQTRLALSQNASTQASLAVESLQRRIAVDIEASLQSLVNAKSSADHAGQHLRQQQQLQNLALHTYQHGATDFVTYQLAQRNALDAEMDALEADYLLQLAALALQQAAGIALST